MADEKTEPRPPGEISPGVEARVLKAEEKMIPLWGKKRKQLEGCPEKRRGR